MIVGPNVDPVAKIKVIGVGGGGGNAVNTMMSEYEIPGVEFLAFNTDAQALKQSLAPTTVQLGDKLTSGLGVGGDPKVGAAAAEESIETIKDHLSGADMVFITAGLGGGTGTGAAPIIAGIAKQMDILTVAVVTTPFKFEGVKRMRSALEGLDLLKDKVDTLIVVSNQRLIDITTEDVPFLEAMKQVDRILADGVNSIASLISNTGLINVDFNDVKSIMQDAGTALMGMGVATGEKRAEEATRSATDSPLLDMSIAGARGVLFQVSGGADISMREVDYAAGLIREAVDPNAEIIFGAEVNTDIPEGEFRITIIATGFDHELPNNDILKNNMTDTVETTKIPKVFLGDTEEKHEKPAEKKTSIFTNRLKANTDTAKPSMAENVNEKPATPIIKINTDKSEYSDDLERPAFMRNK
jgi:cell division protein FtsZ